MMKQLNNGFIQVPRAIFNDKKLSFTAKMIYIYIIDKPEGWRFNMTAIQKTLDISKPTAQKAVKQLEEAKILTRTRKYDEKGVWFDWKISRYKKSSTTEKNSIGTDSIDNSSIANLSRAKKVGSIDIIQYSDNNNSNNQVSNNHNNGENEIFAFLNENLEDLRKEAKEVFDEYYEFNFRSKFIWDGKQHKNLEGLMKKLTEEAHNAGSELTNEKLINYLGTFLNRLPNLSDGFYYNNHYSPAGLNSNYQKILNHAKSRKKSKGHTFSEEGLMRNYAKWKERERMEMERAREKRLRAKDANPN
jgi:DNA-binding Lrp family transcriptional regulator